MRIRKITALAVAIVASVMVANPMSTMAAGITADTTANAIAGDGGVIEDLGEPFAGELDMEAQAIDAGFDGAYTLPDSADLMWAGTQYMLVNKLTHSFAPSGAKVVSVWYMGQEYPAYYWEPANQLILHMYNPMSQVTPYDDLTDQEKEYWQGAYIEKNAAIEFETVQDYQAYTSMEQYLFVFDFDRNTIEPHVEFPTGTGYVVMVDYTPDQEYYLAALSKGFMKFGIFEFEVYQYLTVDDESYYYVVSGMNQDGDVYLYQYDFMKAEAGRVDPNMLIGLRYLDERTLALHETEDQVAAYKNSIRKYSAIGIIVLVVIAFVIANIYFFRGRKKVQKRKVDIDDAPELNEIEDIEDTEDEDEDDSDEVDDDMDEEEVEELNEDDLFYPGDTAYMRAQFTMDESEDEFDDDDEDDFDDEDEEIDSEDADEVSPEDTDDDIELPAIDISKVVENEPKETPKKATIETSKLPKIQLEPEAMDEPKAADEPVAKVTLETSKLPKIQLEPEAMLPEIQLEPEALEEPQKATKKPKKAKKVKLDDIDDDDFDDILDEPLILFGRKNKKKKSGDNDGIIDLDDL